MSATDRRPLIYTDSLNFLLPLRSVGKGKGKEREVIDLDESPRPRREGPGGQQGADAPTASLIAAVKEWAERNAGTSSRPNQVDQPGEGGSEAAKTTDEGNEGGGPSRSAGDDPK